MSNSIVNMCGGSVTINGKTYKNVNGCMTITDKGIFVNGKPLEEFKEAPIVKIEVHGHVDELNTDCAEVEVIGDVKNVNSKNGNIHIDGTVLGNVDNKNGNITVNGGVNGDVTTKNGNISRL